MKHDFFIFKYFNSLPPEWAELWPKTKAWNYIIGGDK